MARLALRSEGRLALDTAALLALEADPQGVRHRARPGALRATACATPSPLPGPARRTSCGCCSTSRRPISRACAGSDCAPPSTGAGSSWPSTSGCPSRSTCRASPTSASRRSAGATCGRSSSSPAPTASTRPASRPSTRAPPSRASGPRSARSRPTCWRPARACAGPPTLDALCERLTAAPYTLLHVVCHGQLLRDGPSRARPSSTSPAPTAGRPRGASELIERLAGLGGARGLPHLAFLCACESASAAPRRRGPWAGSPSDSCANSGCRPWWR